MPGPCFGPWSSLMPHMLPLDCYSWRICQTLRRSTKSIPDLSCRRPLSTEITMEPSPGSDLSSSLALSNNCTGMSFSKNGFRFE